MILIAITAPAGLLLLGFLYEERSRRRDLRRFPPLGRLLQVNDHRLHLLEKGTGVPIVVIEQGAGGPSLAWLPLQEQIAEFARVCIYDRAGYQWSDPVRGQRSLEDRVHDLHTLLVNASLPPPYVLVAHSYGGFLVRLFAREHPADVAGLVLVDTPHEQSYCRPEVLSLYSKLTWFLRAMALLARFGLPRLLNRRLSKPDPNMPLEVSAPLAAGMVRHEYFAAAADDLASVRRAVPWLSKPAAALGGFEDLPLAVVTHGQPFPGPFALLERSWRESQDKLVALSSNSKLFVAENANHMIQNDQPEVVLAAILSVVSAARTRPIPSQGIQM